MDYIFKWVEAHAALAGWAQAIASVAAIFWAGRFTRRQLIEQRKLQEEGAKEARVQRLESFIALCEVAVEEIGTAERYSLDAERTIIYATAFYEPKTFEGLTSALGAFPIHELPGARSVGAAQRFRDGLMHAEKATAAWVKAVGTMSSSVPDAQAYVSETSDYLRSQLSTLKRQLGDYRSERAAI